MLNVTLNVSESTLRLILESLALDKSNFEGELARINSEIRTIETALSPVKRRTVASSDGSRLYAVSKTTFPGYGPDAGVSFECSCPSFQYQRGLDDRSRCKHIRQAAAEGL